MSRIGKAPITVPSGVTLSIEGATVTVKGPKGELKEVIDPEITIDYQDNVQGSQFVIKNPNATTTCGCGSSFSA